LCPIEEASGRSFIDLIVFTPDNRYAIIAGCSVEGITPDKITKVAEKAKSLRKFFTDSQVYTVTVVPAFFTPLKTEELSSSVVNRAKEDRVVIINRDQIIEILENVRRGYPLDQTLRMLSPHHTFI
jgi:fructose-1-phosphate kinase PfkB-like protein